MPPAPAHTITQVLNGQAEPTPADQKYLYDELRKLISAQVRREPGGLLGIGTGGNLTLVVHEAWIKLQSTEHWDNRAHFLGAASRAARQVLIDDARKRKVRESHHAQSLSHQSHTSARSDAQHAQLVLDIDEALTLLESGHKRQAEVASMKLFGDVPTDVICELLDVNPRTVQRDMRFARSFLAAELGDRGK